MSDDAKRQEHLAEIERCRQLGEKAYDDMYEAHSFRDANLCYGDAKEFYWQAMAIARESGLNEELAALEDRLAHIKAVFRSQFVQ
jgi:hypothetical protein